MVFFNKRGNCIDLTIADPSLPRFYDEGFIHCVLDEENGWVTIQNCDVPPQRRNKGRFKEMFNELVKWCRENRISEIKGIITRHPSGPTDEELRNIYKKLGFCVRDKMITYKLVVFTPTIPDEWWQEAGVDLFKPQAKSYMSDSTNLVLMSEIQPLQRNTGVRYFERHRMVPVLKGFVEDAVIPPIEVNEMSNLGQYRYRVHNGAHRFYGSLAAGFEFIPVIVKPYLNL